MCMKILRHILLALDLLSLGLLWLLLLVSLPDLYRWHSLIYAQKRPLMVNDLLLVGSESKVKDSLLS